MRSLASIRKDYHATLRTQLISRRQGVPNIADKDSRPSVEIAEAMISAMGHEAAATPVTPQALGVRFAQATSVFLRDSLAALRHIRPGDWQVMCEGLPGGVARFAQYSHLAEIAELVADRPELRASLGGDYLVHPDVVVFRSPMSDRDIDPSGELLGKDDSIASHSPLRARNMESPRPMLLASVSMKWTMRSDRSQNTRTEALNLIRNRKGSLPKIVVVTIEPLPSRIASIAMGTGDVDCTYHAALPELMSALDRLPERTDQAELLGVLVRGRRLRDISDLPLDLVA